MKNTAKPPMVVALNNMGTGVVKPGEYYDKHIYVHLGQFIAMVESEAQACADEGLSYDAAFVDIIRDKQKELDK